LGFFDKPDESIVVIAWLVHDRVGVPAAVYRQAAHLAKYRGSLCEPSAFETRM
jgi:hypothetical protein